MTLLNVLILSGHMTIEHDNEHRSFRQHNQWLTTLLEDTGRFKVRVVEDPRGLGAEIIDKYDVRDRRLRGPRRLSRQGRRLRRRDGCRAPALRARPRQGHRVVPRLGRAGGLVGVPRGVQRHARREAQRVRDGPAPAAVGRGAAEDRRAASSDHGGHQRDVDRDRRRHPHRRAAVRRRAGAAHDVRRSRVVRERTGVADVALSGRDPGGRHRRSQRHEHRPADRLDQRVRRRPLVHDHDRPRHRHVPPHRVHPHVPARRRVGGDRARSPSQGPDRRGERRFLPWPYYNHEG